MLYVRPFTVGLLCLGGFGKQVGIFYKWLDEKKNTKILVFDRDRKDEEKYLKNEFPLLPNISLDALKYPLITQRFQNELGFFQEPRIGLIWAYENYNWFKSRILRFISEINEMRTENLIMTDKLINTNVFIPVFVVFGCGGGTGAGLIIPTLVTLTEIGREMNVPLLTYAITNSPYSYMNIDKRKREKAMIISQKILKVVQDVTDKSYQGIQYEYVKNSSKETSQTLSLCNHLYVLNNYLGYAFFDVSKTAAVFIKLFAEKLADVIYKKEANERINFSKHNLIFLKGGRL